MLEFVGPNEPDGWPLAGTIVPIAYIAWSIWLIVDGDRARALTSVRRRSLPVNLPLTMPVEHPGAPGGQNEGRNEEAR